MPGQAIPGRSAVKMRKLLLLREATLENFN